MADLDRTASYSVPGELLGETLDAIRTKRGTVASIPLEDMPLEIGLIDGGGGSGLNLSWADTVGEAEYAFNIYGNTADVDIGLTTSEWDVLLVVSSTPQFLFEGTGGTGLIFEAVFSPDTGITPAGKAFHMSLTSGSLRTGSVDCTFDGTVVGLRWGGYGMMVGRTLKIYALKLK